CNALELLDPRFRTTGFTSQPLVCINPKLPPMVGYARTLTIRASEPPDEPPAEVRARRLAYYRYVGDGPRPTVVVVQDVDPQPGFGAFWGEVQSAVHTGLGCLGLVTNGSVRDLDVMAPGFQVLAGSVGPSHAWVHIESFGGAVEVAGMSVAFGDLVHADRHGAVVVPLELASDVPEKAALLARRESIILEAARAPGFDAEKLAHAMGEADEIH
ncbi:MAG: RraA family protein, partial [Alphaproteobacteria bacterium]